MNCRNGRLEGVGTETPRCKNAFGERDAFGDLIFIPQGTTLVVHKIKSPSGELRAARLLRQHEPYEAHHFVGVQAGRAVCTR
jgi:hypothetical protein